MTDKPHSFAILSTPELRRFLRDASKPIPESIIFFALIEFIVIFGASLLPMALLPLSVLIIGSRQHALGVLLHECVHFRFSKRRAVNDLFSDMFLAFPLLVTTHGYRRQHFDHHRNVGDENDPKMQRLSKAHYQDKNIAKKFFKYLFGLYAIRDIKEATFEYKLSIDNPMHVNLRRVIFWAPVFIFIPIKWLLLYWFLPLVTVFMFITFYRSKAEHQAVNGLLRTRTTLGTPSEQVLFAPYNIGYHWEHHAFPSVAWNRLPEVKNYVKCYDHVQVSRGYFDEVYEEVTR